MMKKIFIVWAVDKHGKQYREQFNCFDAVVRWVREEDLCIRRTKTQNVYSKSKPIQNVV